VERARRVTLSAAVFALICFFLPWVQVSCAGLKDTESGFDLARDGDRAVLLVPLLMLAVILLGIMRAFRQRASLFALISMVSGLTSTYLMNRERVDVEQSSDIIGAHVTGWFWLGLFSSLGVAISALMFYLRRAKPRE
jgi:hypothetical protein